MFYMILKGESVNHIKVIVIVWFEMGVSKQLAIDEAYRGWLKGQYSLHLTPYNKFDANHH